MEEKLFVNEFLTIGMQDYFYKSNATSFERHIIECMTDIYGKEELKALFESRDENKFEELLKSNGFKSNMYTNFIDACNKYESFKIENAKNPAIKSDRASNVEISVISMYLCKFIISTPTLESLSHFENDLLNDFSIIKMHFNTSLNPNKTREYWNQKKHILSNNYDLFEVLPEYLDEFTYAKFGVKLEAVKKMDAKMVEKLNNYIKDKINEEESQAESKGKQKTKINGNTVLSSGNGYVDALMIVSIIVTEIAIGLIILFLNY